jgi:hypothetical protein
MTEWQDAIAAFIDGEPVDPEALVAALSDAKGREYLVDLLALRDLVGGEHDVRPAAAPRSAGIGARARQLAIAASLAAVSLIGGYALGQRSVDSSSAPQSPAAISTPDAARAPAPTRVIQLENGVDWTERVGG